MFRGIIVIVWLVALSLVPSLADGQQPGKISRIGFLTTAGRDGQSDRLKSFREGLRELGYVEGQNIVIEFRGAGGKPDQLAVLAEDLVRLEVSIIVTTSTSAVQTCQ